MTTQEEIRERVQPSLNGVVAALLVVSVIVFLVVRLLRVDLSTIGDAGHLLVLLAVVPIVLLFAYMRFETALLVFMFVVAVGKYEIPGVGFFLVYSDVFLIILTAVWFTRMVLRKGYGFRSTFLDRHIFIFTLLSVLAVVNSPSFSAGFKEVVQTVEYLVFSYYLFASAVRSREQIAALMQALVMSAVFTSVCGVYQYFEQGGGDYRVTSTFGHFNAYGAYLAMTTMVTFNLFLSEEERGARTWLAAALTCQLVALMMTFSRGAWIGVIVAIVISAQFRGMVQFVRLFTAMVVLAIFLSLVLPSQFVGRAASITDFSDPASENRIRQYKIAYETIVRRPLLGIGIGSIEGYALSEYQEMGVGAVHNLFLMIGAERGLPAMFALMFFFGSFFINGARRIGETGERFLFTAYLALYSGIAAYFFINMTAYQLVRGLGIMFGMYLGLFQAAMKIEDEEREEKEIPYYVRSAERVIGR
ncbi:MAG: O-antigen ligase family protein [bacterium]